MNAKLAETPLHSWHAAHGGRLVDFAGWSMPVQYSGIVAEHQATREACGLFDVSHMARFEFQGEAAGAFLDSLTTRRVADMNVGQIRYSLMTNEAGGILDDILVYRLQKDSSDPYFGLVVNAGNREKIAAWLKQHLVNASNVVFTDKTVNTAMIALQGPKAIEIASPLLNVDLAGMKYYTGAFATVNGVDGFVSRTGYTGEDGCELIVEADAAVSLWTKLIENGAQAAGLGARDTLRLEAAMPLYGHELSESVDPVQAGLGFAVNLKDREFIGRDAIVEKKKTNTLKRVGIQSEGKRPFREHCLVFHGDNQVGELTSGTFSPTLQKPIGMAYLPEEIAADGAEVEIDIRGRRSPARITKLPFYSRSS